jgi:hypothetical protein
MEELLTPKVNVNANVEIKGFYMSPFFEWFRQLNFRISNREAFKVAAEAWVEDNPLPVTICNDGPDGFLNDE